MKYKKMKFISKRVQYFRLKPLVLAMSAVIPVTATADMVLDPDKKQQANIASAANGTPLININDANSKGISHNKYADFNVNQQGVIFNNSMQDGVSKTGGFALKNSNLSSEAKVILNEVTGARGSQLAGSMEVFGRTADLIIANENGITVNGVSTVNANNLTLSTGKVNFNSQGDVQLAVERGTVTIGSQGINTDGLSYFDIVSRSAALKGEIAGDADVKILTGLNDYDTASRTHTVRSASGANTPEVAISGTQLGSMYGNRIQLISTESGAGVSHQGSIIGSQGIEISADGEISLASVVSKNDSVALAGRSIKLSKYANKGGINAQADVILTALSSVAISADIVAEQGAIRINAGSLLQSAANLLAKNGTRSSSTVPAIQINVADRYVISGALYAVDSNNNKITGARIELSQGKFVVKVGGKTISDATILSDASLVSSAGDIAVSAGSLENSQGVIAAQKGSLIFNLADALVNEGYVQASGSVQLTGKRLKNGGIFSTTDELKLTLGTLENSGTLYAGRIAVSVDEATNQGILVSDKGDLALQVKGKLHNSGTLQANNAARLKAQELQNQGNIVAGADIELISDTLDNSGTIQGKNVSSVSEKLLNSGEVIAEEGDLSLTVQGSGSTINTGLLQAKNGLIATKGELDNQGTIAAQDNLNLFAEKITNSGDLLSYGDMQLTAASELINSGDTAIISAKKTLSITGEQPGSLVVSNREGAAIQSTEGDVNIHSVSSINNTAAQIQASETLNITDAETVANTDGQLTGKNINLKNIARLQNQGADAVVVAKQDLAVSDIERLENTEGNISSWQSITFSNIQQLINSAAEIVANDTIKFDAIGTLANRDGATVSSLYHSVLLNAIENLSNLAGSLIEANKQLSFTDLTTLENSDDSLIQSFGDIQLAEIKNIENAGSIIASASVLLNNVNLLVNKGEFALLQGLDIILAKVANLKNQDYAAILAVNQLKISEANAILNEAAGFIQASSIDITADSLTNTGYESQIVGLEEVAITAKELNNRDQAGIFSDNALAIAAGTINNDAESDINAASYQITADVLNNRGAISSGSSAGSSLIDAASLNNASGTVSNSGALTVNTASLNNEDGRIFGGKSLTLNKEGDFNNSQGMLSSSSLLNINATGDVTIDKALESFASVNITANNIYNNESIVSGGDIYLKAINIVNNINSLIFSMKNSFLVASGKIENLLNGNILSQQSLIMEADAIHNQAGVIRSEGDMWLDAKEIINASTYKGASWDYSAYENAEKSVEEGAIAWGKTYHVNISIPGLTSDIALDVRAEISSGGNLYINQDSDSKGTVNNKGGLIQSGKDMYIKGDLYNAPDYLNITMLDYLKTPLAKDISFHFYYWKSAWTNGNPEITFSSVYQMLDYLYGNGVYNSSSVVELDSDNRVKFSNVLRALGSEHNTLNAIMNKIFGEQWKASDYGDLQSRWAEVIQGNYIPPTEFDPGTSESSSILEQLKIYFLPAEKAAITAGGSFIHSDGSFNNGLATEVAGELQENKVVNVQVGEQEVNTLEQGYEVKFNRKNIEEIAKGISTLPVIGKLTDIKGLFEKSQDFIDYLKSLTSSDSSVQATSAQVQAEAGATNKVVAMYETRPSMIDQSQYYGSDYFFNAIGYKSEQPVLVIGDNYFISELIRRQATESLGTFMSDKYRVEGAGLAQLLFDNAAELAAGETGGSFVVGQALTQEQIASLDKDIVWFVTENVDGLEVLVPKIYLSSKTLEEIKVVNETGAASVHAGENVIVDATSINNNNAVISADNDISLVAQGDIKNISSGMNAGIKAGGSAYLVSDTGNIVNSGSSIAADKDIALVAYEGDVDLIASVGRDDKGNQLISAYDDGISAGGSIDILAKEVTITGVALSAGDVAKADVNAAATEDVAEEPMLLGLHRNSVVETPVAEAEAGPAETSDSAIRIVSTEGNVNFNDIHEVNTSYSSDFTRKNAFATRTETTTEATAKSVTSSINTDGTFVVSAARDAVFTGGEYNAGEASINAGKDIVVKTSQDHTFKENKVTETSFEISAKANVPYVVSVEATANSLTGTEVDEATYQSQGPDGNMSNSRSKRPGAAALSDMSGFSAGIKTTEVTTTETTLTNNNASFNFNNGVNMTAGNTLDIGGMDLKVGDHAAANLSGKDIISTKYEDVATSTEVEKETFVGIKQETHSVFADTLTKQKNREDKKINGVDLNEDMATDRVVDNIKELPVEIDVARTVLETGGDISNVIFNDWLGASTSVGTWEKENSTSSETRTENITNIYGGSINFTSSNNTTLQGVSVVADEINVQTGGDFSLTAAKSTYKSSSSGSSHSEAFALSAGAAPSGAGIGLSVDTAVSTSSRDVDATAYLNGQLDANRVNVTTQGDMNLVGANITAGSAAINVGGDLNITSVQDSYLETASGSQWGMSAGVAVSTSGVLLTGSGSGGGGSEEHTSNLVQQQAGIRTTDEINIVTGGDLNLTGGHIISDSQQGSIDVAGTLTATEIKDELHSGGTYAGGGGGVTAKGTITVNAYENTLDKIDYVEDQHSTINIGYNAGKVEGEINTNTEEMSTVDKENSKVVAGNNISYTIGLPSFNFGKGSSKTKTLNNTETQTSRPTASNSSTATQKPGTSNTGKHNSSSSDSSSAATQKPGTSNTGKHNSSSSDSSSTATQRPGTSNTVTPGKPAAGSSSSTATQRPGTQEASKPNSAPAAEAAKPAGKATSTDSVDAGTPSGAKKWPTVQPVKPIVGGTGSATRPGGNNHAGSAKPANNSPAQNGTASKNSSSGSTESGASVNVNKPAKSWPTVQPVKPIVGGTGSATRPGGNNHAGSAKPANNSPAQNGAASKNSSSGSTENGASVNVNKPAKGWPTVQPAKPIVGGTGSATRPGSVNNAGAAKPANNSPKADSLANKEGAAGKTQQGNAASRNTGGSKWRVLVDNETVKKPESE